MIICSARDQFVDRKTITQVHDASLRELCSWHTTTIGLFISLLTSGNGLCDGCFCFDACTPHAHLPWRCCSTGTLFHAIRLRQRLCLCFGCQNGLIIFQGADSCNTRCCGSPRSVTSRCRWNCCCFGLTLLQWVHGLCLGGKSVTTGAQSRNPGSTK